MSDKQDRVELEAPSRELADLLNRMNTDDPSREDRRALRKVLKEHPDLWRSAGDLSRRAEEQIIKKKSGGTAIVEESLRHGVKQIRKDLGHEDAPALERLLIEQVALTWLHYHSTQHSYHQVTSGSIPITQADYWERRLDAAQRRFLRATKTLGRVRKMAGREALQINIGGQQVNVAG